MDLQTRYAGIDLKSPVVIGASPLSIDVEQIQRFADQGAGAIVMPSMFEEQIVASQTPRMAMSQGVASESEPTMPPVSYEPDLDQYNGGADGYLRNIEKAKSITEIPVIASINCVTTGTWMTYAANLQSAGADAIELNIYHYNFDPHRFSDDIERELIARVREFCADSPLPVAIKLLPQYTCLPNMAYRIAGAGAKSLCLFGQSPAFRVQDDRRIGYRWRLTNHSDLRVTLEGVRQVHGATHNLTIAASGGIRCAEDALLALRLGANLVMVTSIVYQEGGSVIRSMLDAIEQEMVRRRCETVKEFVGSQGGYDAFPEMTRRRDLWVSLSELNSGGPNPEML